MTHMQQRIEGLKVLFPVKYSLEQFQNIKTKRPFDDLVCEFLTELSAALRKDDEAKTYPDVIAFSFFCRKANIEKMKLNYLKEDRLGRGISFHIAPSNVPINFAYSMAAGLLAGNACVIRVSSKDFEQTHIICRIMEELIHDSYEAIKNYILVVQYDHNNAITEYFSAMANIRVVWGGDATVEMVRNLQTTPRCVDVMFADRYSLCVLDSEYVKNITNWEAVAQKFYNDTYLYDQNACSSPRLLYWYGDKETTEQAKELFWSNIKKYITPKYELKPLLVVDKLIMDCRSAIELESIRIEKRDNNLVDRIELTELTPEIVKYTCPGGSYFEYRGEKLEELEPLVSEKVQTLSYLGMDVEVIRKWIFSSGIRGIDRIVPMGNTADFSLSWDGYDLIDIMTRKIQF